LKCAAAPRTFFETFAGELGALAVNTLSL